MSAPITALYASLLSLLVIVLASRIPLLRRKHRVGIGHGRNDELALAIRVHGNAVEYVPLALLLLLLAELQGMAAWGLHLAGSGLFLARILHAIGLGSSAGMSNGRFVGTLLTWTVVIVLAGALLLDTLIG